MTAPSLQDCVPAPARVTATGRHATTDLHRDWVMASRHDEHERFVAWYEATSPPPAIRRQEATA